MPLGLSKACSWYAGLTLPCIRLLRINPTSHVIGNEYVGLGGFLAAPEPPRLMSLEHSFLYQPKSWYTGHVDLGFLWASSRGIYPRSFFVCVPLIWHTALLENPSGSLVPDVYH